MGFVVLPALVADVSAVYDVYFAAFKDNAITRALFPSVTTEDLINPESEFRKGHTAHVLQYWQDSLTQYTLKCVDSENGKVVGMALWDVYITPSTWKKGPLWDTREKMWNNERYLYCHVVAVHPDSQRRGIGELLVDYGKKIALQAHLPIYVESSQAAVKLYEKSGFRWLKERPVHKGVDLWPGRTDNNQENHDVPLFVWIPEGAEKLLPEAVKLA